MQQAQRRREATIEQRKLEQRILKAGLKPHEQRDHAFRQVIRSIPEGKVATYGQVAAAAGYPLYHRAVARLLRNELPGRLPWQRVVGAGGFIKLHGESAAEQRLRLKFEGVAFRGRHVDMDLHAYQFAVWEIER